MSFRKLGRKETGKTEATLENRLRSSLSSTRFGGKILNVGVPPILSGMEVIPFRERSRILREGKSGRTLARSSHDSSISSSSREVMLSKPVPKDPSSLLTSAFTSSEENLFPLILKKRSSGKPRQIASMLCRESKRFRDKLRSSISAPDMSQPVRQ